MGVKKKIVKVAFAGAGNMAEEHIKVFKNLDKYYALTGIYSRTKSKANILKNRYKINNLCNSISDLKFKSKAKLLVISTSVLSTKKVLFEALKFNWKILVEKPIGFNFQESHKIYESIKKSKKMKHVFVGIKRRNFESTRKAIFYLKKKMEKRIVEIFDFQYKFNPTIQKHPKLVQKYWMYANSVHLIDYFNIFCRGSLVSINYKKRWDEKKMDSVIAKLHFSSGDIGKYNCYWNKNGKWKIFIKQKKNKYIFQPLEKLRIKNSSKKYKDVKLNLIKEKNSNQGFINKRMKFI